MDDMIAWLEAWYTSSCDGTWEHTHGIKIGTLDNPGWKISIDLEGTVVQEVRFLPVKVDRSEADWFVCSVQDGRFNGFGGVSNLHDLIEVFRTWAEAVAESGQ